MDIQGLLGKLQTPEQMDEFATKLAQWGRPPVGLPGQAPAQPAMSPAALPPQAPQAPDLGTLLAGGQ